jgi:mannitol-1-phosphate 5-dehydrogenase
MKKKILIYGAGAIGRGYLPWIFSEKYYDFYFVDINKSLIILLRKKKYYESFKIFKNKYFPKKIHPKKIYQLNEEIDHLNNFDLVVICVGTRQAKNIFKNISLFKKTIICLENDPLVVEEYKKKTKKKNMFFGIPDVISSNTAPKEIKKKNKINLITEDGVCYIDKKCKIKNITAKFLSEDDLKIHWLAKLYIHNSSHCISAYLGSILKKKFIHEALENSNIKKIVKDCINELSIMLNKKYNMNKKFIANYGTKELKRFSNKLLFDPITRVAREPFRKLQIKERLIGAANECLSVGIEPNALSLGIMSAINYNNSKDEDSNLKILRKALNLENFLKIILNLRIDEPLYQFLIKNWKKNQTILKLIKYEYRK